MDNNYYYSLQNKVYLVYIDVISKNLYEENIISIEYTSDIIKEIFDNDDFLETSVKPNLSILSTYNNFQEIIHELLKPAKSKESEEKQLLIVDVLMHSKKFLKMNLSYFYNIIENYIINILNNLTDENKKRILTDCLFTD